MATDDIKVGLKVTLDEESMAREVEKAEGKMGRGKPGGPSTAGGAIVNIVEQMKIGVTKPIVDRLEKIERKLGGEGASGSGLGFIKGLAAAVVIFGLLDAFVQAIKAVVSAVWNLAQSLSRFSPALAVAFRQLQIAMRILAIEMGEKLGPVLAEIVRDITEIVVLLARLLLPILKALLYELSKWIEVVRKVVHVLYWLVTTVLKLVSQVMAFIGTLMVWWGQTLGKFDAGFTEAGKALLSASDATRNFALELEKARQSLTGHSDAVSRMNQALIKGFSDVAGMSYTGVTAPGAGDSRNAPGFNAPLVFDPHGKIRTYTGATTSVAAGRSAVSMQPPALASVVNNVQLNAEVKMQHEEAVQRAIEEVRGVLVRAIHGVRNEQLLLSSRIYARTVIDL